MSSPHESFDFRSDPPILDDNFHLGSSPKTPSNATENANITDISTKRGGNVVNSIIFDRSSRSAKYADNPHYIGSSPLTPRDRSELKFKEQQKKFRNQRVNEKERKSVKNRGGLEKMEDFIMNGERKRELDDMARLAQENAIPEDMVDTFENEEEEPEILDSFKNDEESDDDLIQYFEDKEKYEKELEQLLSELSVS